MILASRPARGAWVEILILIDEIGVLRRAPQGARGLKFVALGIYKFVKESRPARGAWVEISPFYSYPFAIRSRPARGAWVEILCWSSCSVRDRVAPRKGRVG